MLCFQTEYAHYENGHFVYRIHRSPMCEYMINFIHKLKHLPEKYMMNSVLENFTILQASSRALAAVFAVMSYCLPSRPVCLLTIVINHTVYPDLIIEIG